MSAKDRTVRNGGRDASDARAAQWSAYAAGWLAAGASYKSEAPSEAAFTAWYDAAAQQTAREIEEGLRGG